MKRRKGTIGSIKSLTLSEIFWIRKERMVGTTSKRVASQPKKKHGKSEV